MIATLAFTLGVSYGGPMLLGAVVVLADIAWGRWAARGLRRDTQAAMEAEQAVTEAEQVVAAAYKRLRHLYVGRKTGPSTTSGER